MATMLVDRVERPLGKGVTVRGLGCARSAPVAAPRRVAGVVRPSAACGKRDGLAWAMTGWRDGEWPRAERPPAEWGLAELA